MIFSQFVCIYEKEKILLNDVGDFLYVFVSLAKIVFLY